MDSLGTLNLPPKWNLLHYTIISSWWYNLQLISYDPLNFSLCPLTQHGLFLLRSPHPTRLLGQDSYKLKLVEEEIPLELSMLICLKCYALLSHVPQSLGCSSFLFVYLLLLTKLVALSSPSLCVTFNISTIIQPEVEGPVFLLIDNSFSTSGLPEAPVSQKKVGEESPPLMKNRHIQSQEGKGHMQHTLDGRCLYLKKLPNEAQAFPLSGWRGIMGYVLGFPISQQVLYLEQKNALKSISWP